MARRPAAAAAAAALRTREIGSIRNHFSSREKKGKTEKDVAIPRMTKLFVLHGRTSIKSAYFLAVLVGTT